MAYKGTMGWPCFCSLSIKTKVCKMSMQLFVLTGWILLGTSPSPASDLPVCLSGIRREVVCIRSSRGACVVSTKQNNKTQAVMKSRPASASWPDMESPSLAV